MSGIDYRYIAKSTAELSGVPVRVYKGGEEFYRSFPVYLPRDPMEIYKKEIFGIASDVGYYATPLFHYYGVINSGDVKIVIGPTAQIMANGQKLRELAFKADVAPDEVNAFVEGMNSVARMPVEKLLQTVCLLNHFLNGGQTLEIHELSIRQTDQVKIKKDVERQRTEYVYDGEEARTRSHNTLALEEAIMDIVRRGDAAALKRWTESAPAISGGTIAADQLRQLRNTFIVTATLVSRAAIRGGMSEDDAFTLSDAYIRRAEMLSGYDEIMNLQYNMLFEFTEQVGKLRRGRYETKLTLDVANYVRHHLSEKISVEKMAEEFFFSRPYLSAKFKAETGVTLTEFILKEKTEEAKRLLRYSDKPISAISAYLGFSSCGHFSGTFKKYARMTPNEYREKHV